MSDKVLGVRDLRTWFYTQDGVVSAVDGLSFDLAAGHMVGLVGESGCGKSTAALSIMRLVPAPGRIVGGQIWLDGQDILQLSESEMRGQRGPGVAMIFQDALAALNPTMRVGRQLIEPLQVHLKMSSPEAEKRAIELLDRVGIPSPRERMGAYPHEFSGGMRQRVMIAMALSCEPKVLLADEPTTALDVTIQRQILDLMVSLGRETGAGVILITHDVGVVSETCDRVVVMYAGHKVESGPTEEVFVHPQHPYTLGLLSATLDLEHARDRPLQTIPGMPPDLIDVPSGCLFWPRCARQTHICHEQTPTLTVVGMGREVACWHWDE
jgi:oligopeptide transport system ATP-binding protein